MTNSNRIILNAIILYIKVALCAVISLLSVRIVLRTLGAADFGLFNLIAGVIAMLAFLNASMTVSTQRYLSVAIGENNLHKINCVYNASIWLHIVIGFIIVILFEIAAPFLFSGFLNIDAEKIPVAKLIYQLLVVNMFASVITVPFNAILNAYENMFTFSIIAITDSVLKLGVALLLTVLSTQQLQIYSLGIMSITILVFLMTFTYTAVHYKHLKISLKAYWDKSLFKEMLIFCWWNTFGGFAMACKNQGIAIVQNLFFGTIINAAMGIANQINGVLSLFSANIQKSVNPQLMMSEGENDMAKRSHLTYSLSKFSTLALSVVAIPLIVEMPFVLQWWLGDVPEYTIIFSQLTLVASLIYQLSSGLMSAIQSNGDIKLYQITISTLVILNIPLSYLCLKLFGHPEWTLLIMIILEIVCLVCRMLTAHNKVNINFYDFALRIILPVVLIAFATYLVSYFITTLMSPSWLRLFVVCLISVLIIGIGSWQFILNLPERNACLQFVKLKFHIHA